MGNFGGRGWGRNSRDKIFGRAPVFLKYILMSASSLSNIFPTFSDCDSVSLYCLDFLLCSRDYRRLSFREVMVQALITQSCVSAGYRQSAEISQISRISRTSGRASLGWLRLQYACRPFPLCEWVIVRVYVYGCGGGANSKHAGARKSSIPSCA